MTPRDDATEAQVRAAHPDTSTWLAANAGSGKTRVLTDRVARLLLDGVNPQHILCLTYTKAAASEMQNRLFKRLGGWAMLDDKPLQKALAELGLEEEAAPEKLREARRLFAAAIETPGGLKIQTIHSFCSALLRRFPLEAGVSPQFSEIEERADALLQAEVLDQMADGPEAPALAAVARFFQGEDLTALTREIVSQSDGFSSQPSQEQIWNLFDIPGDLSSAQIEASTFLGTEDALLAQVIPFLEGGGASDNKAAVKLRKIETPALRDLPLLESVFLYGGAAESPFGAKIGRFPTKAVQQQLGALLPDLEDFMRRVEQARPLRLALAAAERTLALHGFARPFLDHYEAQKSARGWLSFDDLINRARALLSDETVAAWVLFRLDGGIDHILVDEAQDTSPAQWDVVRKLAAEFSSGKGARDNQHRTIFVVGDKKQSIYSFQGADPREFDRMQQEFGGKFAEAARPFVSRELLYSFRSSQAVLRLVDDTFARAGGVAFDGTTEHIAFKQDLPGRVDLWPVIPPQADEDDPAWDDPVDRPSATHHNAVLSARIADQIAYMLKPENGVTIPVEDKENGSYRRPVQAGDILILMQGRTLSSDNSLFNGVIRALKDAGLPVAGADRLRVGAELAVRDLTALLSFLAMPEDSLSLASALRSPLFGWSEQQIYSLAHGRGKQHLWQVLRNEACPATDRLKDLRANIDFLRPYDLLERILTRHDARRRLIARLGAEAEDGIDALLSQALAYERNAIPSLTGFLAWLESDDLMIKRQVDSASNQIRVMTVHGAKGLEAPIVILPDCGDKAERVRDDILRIDGTPVWKTLSADMPGPLAEAVNIKKAEDAQERLRLLYVALTRAEKWLIVAAAGNLPKSGNSWYQRIEAAFEHQPAYVVEENGWVFQRAAFADWDGLPLGKAETSVEETPQLPAFMRQPAPPAAAPVVTVSPSDLGGAKALPGEEGRDEESAKQFGTLVHALLDHLPGIAIENRRLAIEMLSVGAEDLIEEASAEALRLLDNPDLQELFAPDTLSEVALTAPLGSARLSGIADRVLLSPGRVLVVDFKTNRRVPDSPQSCPEGLLRQMGAYVHALEQIYPDREINAAILWTKTAQLMPLSHEIVTQALSRTQYLDDGIGHT